MWLIPVHAARTHLSRLIERALAGEEIVISRAGVPAVRLVPVDAPARSRVFGALKGRIPTDDRLYGPLPASDLRDWEGAE